MEFNAEILQLIFIAMFIVGVFTLFRVKYLLKKSYPEQHDEIYGSSLLEYSASNSIKIVRFSLFKKEWGFVQDNKLLFWLRFYRFVSIVFYSFIFFSVMYMVIMVIIELYKSQ